MKSLPGSRWQSAQEASFDTWIKHYRQNENSPNVMFSYYTQGAVIGWMLDMEIRKSTGSSRTLGRRDEKDRTTETYGNENRGFTDEEFERICEETSGSGEIKTIFKQRVEGRTDVDFDRYLGYAGLKLVPKKEERGIGFLGVRLKEEDGRVMVTTVLSSSPAERGGLSPSDEVIGANGIRMDRARLSFYLSNRKPGELITLSVARLGSLFQIESRLIEKPVLEFRITKNDQASDERKTAFRKLVRCELV